MGAAVPIIVAIIGISGVVIPAFSAVFINQVYNKPNLNIHIGAPWLGFPPHAENTTRVFIDVTNLGTMPATNLSLLLTANDKTIYNITNLLSTANLTFAILGSRPSPAPISHTEAINGPNVEIHTKKFVNGGGSIIQLFVDARNADNSDYTVYATYDQGSTKANVGERPPSISDYLLSNLGTYGIFYFIAAESIVLAYYLYRVWKQIKKEFFEYIIQDMMNVRKSVRNKPLTPDIIYDKNWNVDISDKRKVGGAVLKRFKRRKLKVFNDINDYLRIDDFYSKLAERNSYINNNQAIDDIAMVKLNKKCLDLAEDALEKIDWSKYK